MEPIIRLALKAIFKAAGEVTGEAWRRQDEVPINSAPLGELTSVFVTDALWRPRLFRAQTSLSPQDALSACRSALDSQFPRILFDTSKDGWLVLIVDNEKIPLSIEKLGERERHRYFVAAAPMNPGTTDVFIGLGFRRSTPPGWVVSVEKTVERITGLGDVPGKQLIRMAESVAGSIRPSTWIEMPPDDDQWPWIRKSRP